MAAVQGIYQALVLEEPIRAAKRAERLVTQWKSEGASPEPEWQAEAEPESALLLKILEGVEAHEANIDTHIEGSLREGWKLSRLDATVRAILRAGGYELIARQDVPPAVVINEYVDVAHAFFEDSEPGFVNATLDALAKQVRDA